ncbi:MAG: DNA polymerase III subunit gamma/tau [Verrucomicrobia bacterium]|nr:DNA polymerase III subunit gamma/tau [Verrucomicrobiota bacterium]
MSYTVFARKYRPQTFDDVVGQEHITRTLKNAIQQNRLAHAYLFVGPRGTGKTSSARILAKALNCLASDKPTVSPCGECDSCREIAGGNSLDVLEFDAASNTQVDKVREIIIDNVKYMPSRGRYKVYLVDEVHMLSAGSFNALLKTLEEPPQHVKFLFATTDVQKLPATILSRCQRFDLKRIGAPVIAGHLKHIAAQEGVALSDDAALAVAVGADGGMRDAESMLDQLVAFCGDVVEEKDVLSVFGFSSRQTVSDLCGALLAQDAPQAMRLVHEQAEAGRDLTQLMGDLIGHFRNLLLAQADPQGLEAELGNKQMYLEVALLRAIQAVSQVTLGEVLDALGAIREGRPPAQRSLPVAPARSETKPSRPASVGAPVSKPPAATPSKPAAPAALPPATAAARESGVPAPEVPPAPQVVPQPAVVLETPKAAEAVNPRVWNVEELWPAMVEMVRKERPLISMWVEAGVLAEIEGDIAHLGFPSDQTLAVEYVAQENNRSFLEGILRKVALAPLKLSVGVRDGVRLRPVAQPPPPEKAVPKDPMEEFKNDPLIKKALEIFKARLEAV